MIRFSFIAFLYITLVFAKNANSNLLSIEDLSKKNLIFFFKCNFHNSQIEMQKCKSKFLSHNLTQFEKRKIVNMEFGVSPTLKDLQICPNFIEKGKTCLFIESKTSLYRFYFISEDESQKIIDHSLNLKKNNL